MTSKDAIVFLNGRYLPIQEASVSVLDRGFLFGDGVYEVIPVYSNQIFRLAEHLFRLATSLSLTGIKNPLTATDWENIFSELVRRNPEGNDKSLYLQVTRGTDTVRDHFYSDTLVPTIFAMCRPIAVKDYSQGITAITHEDIRWKYCHIKAITLLPNIMLRQLALNTDGSIEAILLRGGVVTEGAASNVFIVKDGIVTTPPKDITILPGVTRDLLVELLFKAGLSCEETSISHQQLLDADEVWITGSLAGIAPVVKLDGRPIDNGQPGPFWKVASRLFNEYKLQI